MVYEYHNNNPWDELEEIFSTLKAQFLDIFCNMAILIATLENKFIPLKEFGISKLEFGLEKNIDIIKTNKRSKKIARVRVIEF